MMEYLDFGSSESEGEDGNQGEAMDSDEEERRDNARILRMLSMHTTEKPDRSKQKVLDFEAEMEAELDRRAFAVENEGGLEHQRSLSRSSSSSSLHSLPGSSSKTGKASSSSPRKTGNSSTKKKKVSFAEQPGQQQPPGIDGVGAGGSTSDDTANTADPFYDKVYFDSDESEGDDDETKKRKKAKRKFVSNEDLFYDPEMDAEDQAWVDKQRKSYSRPGQKMLASQLPGIPGSSNANAGPSPSVPDKGEEQGPSSSNTSTAEDNQSEVPLPKTDAVLNCPACFTVLCMDCQRHECYAGQFRAMFVMNCRVDKSETLTVPLKKTAKKGKRDKKRGMESAEAIANIANSSSDKFFPVRCRICNSQVAVYDSEEIYHFFNCLASQP